MNLFDKCMLIIFKHEGGYVNDPDDWGGETKYGIAKRFFPNEDIKNLTMVEQSMMGGRSWINNVGAAMDQRNVKVRYGLNNRTKEENRALKSSDHIGITPVVITADMEGKTEGVLHSY